MNSLYGRFGINPKSTITKICSQEEYDNRIRKDGFLYGELLGENHYLCSYLEDSDEIDDYRLQYRNSAVQLAAAITASARIYMHPFISRDDSDYTDTDSVVLSQPLPDEFISNTEIGKFKLVKEGLQKAIT